MCVTCDSQRCERAIDSLVEVTHWRRPLTNLPWPKFDPTEGPSPFESSRRDESNGVGLDMGSKNRPLAPNSRHLHDFLHLQGPNRAPTWGLDALWFSPRIPCPVPLRRTLANKLVFVSIWPNDTDIYPRRRGRRPDRNDRDSTKTTRSPRTCVFSTRACVTIYLT